MAINPINVGRVSENLKTLTLLNTLRDSTLKLFDEETRLATGYQLLAPSENPASAAKAIQMDQLLEQQDQILTNLSLADGFLSATDSAIVDINTALIEAQSLASEHSGNVTDQDQRDAAAIVVSGLIDQLVMIGNSTYEGRYLFGGQQVNVPPFIQESGYVEFVGDTGQLLTHVDQDNEAAYNLAGDRLFGALSAEVAGWQDWDPFVTTDTRLSDCGGTTGTSITLGSIEIAETAIATFTVDLTQADDVGDVIDRINQAAADAGSTVTASINPAGNGIRLTSGGATVEVSEVANGRTAGDLGLLTGGAVAVPIDGGDLDPHVTKLTQLQDLGGVNLADLAAGFVITNGGQSAVIDTGSLAGTDTVQDLLNLIDRAEVNVKARINDAGTGIDIVNRLSGAAMSIGENGGSTAEALGVRSMHAGTSLSSLNRGDGVEGNAGESDFRIVARDGTSFEVDINDVDGGLDVNGDGSETLDDIIFAINTAAAGAGVSVTASMATTGNGIRLVDSTGVAGTLQVERMNLSYAVDDLGLAGLTATGAGATVEVVGEDVGGVRADGVFTALYDLHEALLKGDTEGILAASERIDEAMAAVNHVLGEVGARAKSMSERLQRTQEAVDATKVALSEVRDLDYTEAITRFQQAQTALQANLMAGSQALSLSLLDFLG